LKKKMRIPITSRKKDISIMKIKSLHITQKFGDFYVIKMKACDLLRVTCRDTYRLEEGRGVGHQRDANAARLKSIKKYIESEECAFPNSIIIAANYDRAGFIVDEESSDRWRVKDEEIIIPEGPPIAAIIDGQHRVLGFSEVSSKHQEMELVCSIYFDLPTSLQAYLFATINSNQKRVNKSLEYELFGYELIETEYKQWSPDKLAISIAVKLNEHEDSPLKGKIKTALVDSEDGWSITFAGVVDGILRLITSNPNDDRSLLYRSRAKTICRSDLRQERPKDISPLRDLYLNCRDSVLNKIITNYLASALTSIPKFTSKGSVLRKTVGLQGLFDFLSRYIKSEKAVGKPLQKIDFSRIKFDEMLGKAANVDFDNEVFMSTGVGKKRVRDTFLHLNEMIEVDKLDAELKKILLEK